MPAPSKLTIATSSVTRLLKEEASYHKELEQQEARIKKAEQNTEGENAEFQMNQEVRAWLALASSPWKYQLLTLLACRRRRHSKRPKPSSLL